MHPYKPEFIQQLRIGDYGYRLQFLAWFSVQFEIDNLFYNNTLRTDESKFTNNGIMDKQNNRSWEDTNPHQSQETNFQTVWGIIVWCGIILGPYFYDGTFTGRRYLDFFVNQLPLLLENVSLAS